MTLTEKKSTATTELEVHGNIQKCFIERLRPHIAKLLNIVASEANPTVENQVGDVIITTLVRVGLFRNFRKFYGKIKSHCGSFKFHNTQSDTRLIKLMFAGRFGLQR